VPVRLAQRLGLELLLPKHGAHYPFGDCFLKLFIVALCLVSVKFGKLRQGMVQRGRFAAVSGNCAGVAGARMSFSQHFPSNEAILKQSCALELQGIDGRLVVG
jgi:hypothetical protein